MQSNISEKLLCASERPWKLTSKHQNSGRAQNPDDRAQPAPTTYRALRMGALSAQELRGTLRGRHRRLVDEARPSRRQQGIGHQVRAGETPDFSKCSTDDEEASGLVLLFAFGGNGETTLWSQMRMQTLAKMARR